MATDKQIAANRKNAQKSTGPGDTSQTRYNACWHGFRGSRVVIEGEDIEEYNAMSASMYQIFQPVGTYEYTLVKRMADRTWELERVQMLKGNALMDSQFRDILQDDIDHWERWENRIERSLIRLRKELSSVQKLRGQTYNPAEHDSADHPILFETETYAGPKVESLFSEGEVAVHHLTQRAKDKLRRSVGGSGVKGLENALLKLAELSESTDPMDHHRPLVRDPDQ